MPDLAKIWNAETQTADFSILGAGFAESAGLESAVINSLFSDARAPDELLADMAARQGVSVAQLDPRGWWGDSYLPEIAGEAPDRFGSLLWTLGREKQTNETLNRARDFAAAALAWMVSDGLARSVDVSAEWFSRGVLALRIPIVLPDGRRTELHFNYALGAL